MATAFQSSAFQNDAFQIDLVTGGWGGGGFVSASELYRDEKAKRDALAEINKEIAVIERKEKPLKRKAKRNTDAEAALLALQVEINALRLEREALLRMIDDEEAMFVLLAANPFN